MVILKRNKDNPKIYVFAYLSVRAQLSVVCFIAFYASVQKTIKRIMFSVPLEMLIRVSFPFCSPWLKREGKLLGGFQRKATRMTSSSKQ